MRRRGMHGGATADRDKLTAMLQERKSSRVLHSANTAADVAETTKLEREMTTFVRENVRSSGKGGTVRRCLSKSQLRALT